MEESFKVPEENRGDYDDDIDNDYINYDDGCNGCEKAPPMERNYDIAEPLETLIEDANINVESRDDNDYNDEDYINYNDGCNGCEKAPPMERSETKDLLEPIKEKVDALSRSRDDYVNYDDGCNGCEQAP